MQSPHRDDSACTVRCRGKDSHHAAWALTLVPFADWQRLLRFFPALQERVRDSGALQQALGWRWPPRRIQMRRHPDDPVSLLRWLVGIFRSNLSSLAHSLTRSA